MVLSFLALAQGCRVMSMCPGTNTCTWHAHYITCLQCADGATLPAVSQHQYPYGTVLPNAFPLIILFSMATFRRCSRCYCFSNYFTATATNMKCTAPSTCFPYSCCSVVSTFHCMCCNPVLLLIVVAVAWFYFSL